MTIKIIFASPGQGKSYYATYKACEALKDGRTVYSNYPIITPKGLSSCVWKPEYCLENVRDAVIIIDEAYRDMSSRDYSSFTVDEHTFFATNRHNHLDIYLIAQNPARIDVILREICSEFLFIKKISIPFTRWLNKLERDNIPLIFIVYGYLDEIALANRYNKDSDKLSWVIFNRKVAKSYDTHFYSNDDDEFVGVHWSDYLKCENDNNEKSINTENKNHVCLILRGLRETLKARKENLIRLCADCRVACLSWLGKL